MSMKLNSCLEKLGLSKGEIKVYLGLINLGSATTGPIVKKSNISSSKVYDVLDKLEKKGLVSHIVKEKTKYFQVSNLNSIIQYIEEKEKEIREIKKEIKKEITLLEKNRENNPEEARIFKGYKGIKSGFLEVTKSISKNKEYLFFSIGYGKDPLLQQFFRDLALTLKKRGIKIRGIANIREKDLFEKYYKKFHYSMRYTKVNLPSDVTITENNVIIFVWNKEQPVIYIIQSKPLAESYKKFFNDLWKKSAR